MLKLNTGNLEQTFRDRGLSGKLMPALATGWFKSGKVPSRGAPDALQHC